MMQSFSYKTPESIEDALACKQSNEHASYIAGGTDLIPLLKYRVKEPTCLIQLSNISILKEVRQTGEGVFIGAMILLRDLCDDASLAEKLPSLVQAARRVASPQIRNMASIGGNILQDRRCMYFNQSAQWRSNLTPCYKVGGDVCLQAPNAQTCRALYYSDIAPVLMSLGAQVVIFDGIHHRMPVEEFLTTHIERNGGTQASDSILLGFHIPRPQPNAKMRFDKQSLRESINFPIFNMASKSTCFEDSFQVNIVVGAASPEPFALTKTKEIIANAKRTAFEKKCELAEIALAEVMEKSNIIRETGLSVKAKRNSFRTILNFLEKCIDDCQSFI